MNKFQTTFVLSAFTSSWAPLSEAFLTSHISSTRSYVAFHHRCHSSIHFPAILSINSPAMLRSIIYTPSPPSLRILNQLALPHQEIYLPIANATDAWHAIARMQVRGAPAIALVAALALAVEIHSAYLSSPSPASSSATGVAPAPTDASSPTTESPADAAHAAADGIAARLAYLVTARPTAVNLADAARKLTAVVCAVARADAASARTVREGYVTAAGAMLAADVRDNERIGEEGARWIVERERRAAEGEGRRPGRVSVLTHCNTG